MDDVPKLSDEHLEKAKEMLSGHRTKKNCKSCYDRGYQGINQMNMVIPCHKCVDVDEVTKQWQAYVRDTAELAEAYGDYFESDEEEEGGAGDEDRAQATTRESARQNTKDRNRPHSGGQPHRSVGR